MNRNKRVSLERYDMEVSPEAYEQILAIARANAVCRSCGSLYSEESPNVAGLLCLTCFLKDSSLTYRGLLDPELVPDWSRVSYGPWGRHEHLFLDAKGNAYTTTSFPSSDERATEWERVTVCYWQFPLPQEANWNGETIPLRRFSLSIFGNVRESETVLLRFYDYVQNKTQEVLFLARRNGQAIQINKRKGLHRQIFAEARAEIESTKNESGKFFVNGGWVSWIQDGDIYRLVIKNLEAQRSAAQLIEGRG